MLEEIFFNYGHRLLSWAHLRLLRRLRHLSWLRRAIRVTWLVHHRNGEISCRRP